MSMVWQHDGMYDGARLQECIDLDYAWDDMRRLEAGRRTRQL
jgi:hypothetical protein